MSQVVLDNIVLSNGTFDNCNQCYLFKIGTNVAANIPKVFNSNSNIYTMIIAQKEDGTEYNYVGLG